ncbi:MAG: hypothetical protein HOJ25_02400, partial [Candidatus Magasanikbacteria bacterium]|nr:hypothetical protein [Candidatus Magasanikbacteria bacterium]
SFSINKPVITVSLADINTMMGCDMEEKFVIDTLTKLGFGVSISGDEFSVSVPSWRATGDIAIPEDIIEEIARMYGYGNVPEVLPSFPIEPSPTSPLRDIKKRIVEILSRVHGFTEHYSYAFVSPDWLDRLNIDKTKHIELANPLAKDRPLIRRSIVPNMLESVEKNFHRFDEIALFELGPVFYSELEGTFEDTSQKDRLPKQDEVLGLVYGAKNESTPFFTVSDAVLDLFARLGVVGGSLKKVGVATESGLEHPGRMAEIFVGDTLVGRIAEVHPVVQKAVGIPHRVVFAEVFVERILEHTSDVLDYVPISQFPTSQRDVAFTVAKSVAHNDIVQTVSSCSDLITSVELFDVYEGENLEEGQKSMAYHVVYGLGDRTLKNEEVSEAHKHVVSMLSEQYDATVRK